MVRNTNSNKIDEWISERARKGYKFTYEYDVRFGYTVATKVLCEDTNESIEYKYQDKQVKNKLPMEIVELVRKDWFTIDGWLKGKSKKKDTKCQNCNKEYRVIADLATTPEGAMIGLLQGKGIVNQHLCHNCSELYINLGAKDIKKEIDLRENRKETLIKDIRELGNYKESNNSYYKNMLDDKKIEDLEKIFIECKALKDEQDRIDAIVISEEDSKIDDYLITDYKVIQDTEYLKCTEQIEDYFKADSSDLFECGQGYYQDEAEVICKIGSKYYNVTIYAEIVGGSKDYGDRTYYVEGIKKVTYEEIDKPEPKGRFSSKFVVENLTEEDLNNIIEEDLNNIIAFLNENNYPFELD